MLLTWHNVAYYQHLMAGMREAIAAGSFAAFADGPSPASTLEGDIEPWAASETGGCMPMS